MKIISIAFVFSLLLYSCQKPVQNGLLNYFPSKTHLKEGIANKYYYHYKSDDGFTKTTDIQYIQYHFLDPRTIVMTTYNAAFEKVHERYLATGEESINISQEKAYMANGDSIEQLIDVADYLTERSGEYHFKVSGIRGSGWLEETQNFRIAQEDSSGVERDYLLLRDSTLSTFSHPEKDTIKALRIKKTTMASGLGLFEQEIVTEEGQGRLELIEQIPIGEFKKMRAHTIRRIAYIDPEESITDDSGFELCGSEKDIFDYYNSDPDSHFPEKDRLRKFFHTRVEPEKLKNESGYLTYRFVINCQGETGRYITEEADLDFTAKEFDRGVVNYLLGLLLQLDGWKVEPIRNTVGDVYAYITFKMKDGEIIELLP
ncbi:MAG: hypothetical protein RLP14_09590 [Owenweeksia sp.]